jgi:uncharacterized membrane protein YfcA
VAGWSGVIMLVAIGAVVGFVSGMLGIGGAILVIPALVLICKFDQARAVGTSLTMLLPPIGIFAVLQYWRAGQVDFRAAGIMAATFALAAWGGALLVAHNWVPQRALRLLFCAFLIYVTGNMLFRTERRVWAALGTVGLMAFYGTGYLALRLAGRRWETRLTPSEVYQRRLQRMVPVDYEI